MVRPANGLGAVKFDRTRRATTDPLVASIGLIKPQ